MNSIGVDIWGWEKKTGEAEKNILLISGGPACRFALLIAYYHFGERAGGGGREMCGGVIGYCDR